MNPIKEQSSISHISDNFTCLETISRSSSTHLGNNSFMGEQNYGKLTKLAKKYKWDNLFYCLADNMFSKLHIQLSFKTGCVKALIMH